MKKIIICCLAILAMYSCKTDPKNENNGNTSTVTEASADATPGKDSLILTVAPSFTDQGAINFAAEYDLFLNDYRKAVKSNNVEETHKLMDKFLDLAKQAASISEHLTGEEKDKFQQFLTARQGEYAEITSGDKY